MSDPTPLLSALEEQVRAAGLLRHDEEPERLIRRWLANSLAEAVAEMSHRDLMDAIEDGGFSDLTTRTALEDELQVEFECARDDHAAENDQTLEQAMEGGFDLDWVAGSVASIKTFWAR